ncbi:MAG: UDP-N-acetylmuramoyl-tripeptide--D-alanyl-D-alanine ligase [Clostridiales bacterium]|jgi:UDP-N-acetylmuramoyl-tripeptide--D-alanyl-D-alanine ligase|nr:UDP-N-acetylmuramoyl-tripeptide--D-alanyl-D-alanine ligase [Clostridiales bacterium]
MVGLSIQEIIDAVSGELIFNPSTKNSFLDIKVSGVEIDSRKCLQGKLFIAIRGENFDGHSFIEGAFDKGAVCCISEKYINISRPYIKVADTKEALLLLAGYYRRLFGIKVVAITGSSGKTTTKDMVAAVLSQKYNTLKTSGNFNNEIGLPLTIFKINPDTEVCVLEMGMNHFGEIHNLSKVAAPDIALITNIGVSHIENLGSRKGILKAKTEIFDYMGSSGEKILCGDDDMLKTLPGQNIIFYGSNSDNNFYAANIIYNGLDGVTFDINSGSNSFNVCLKKPGKHMVLNALAASAVGAALGLSNEQIKNGLESFEASDMRMEVIKSAGYTILNDVYNANPDSMKAALDVLSHAPGRKICILGDMLELGSQSPPLHNEVGEYAYNSGIDIIISVGDKAYNIYEGAAKLIVVSDTENQRAIYFEGAGALFENLNKILQKDDTILVKASRGMHFEEIVENILLR